MRLNSVVHPRSQYAVCNTGIVSNNDVEMIYLSFAPDVDNILRQDLHSRFEGIGESTTEGLSQQNRADMSHFVVLGITLVGSGFGQRFGDLAADRFMSIVKNACEWLRSWHGTSVKEDSASCSDVVDISSVVEILDKETGLTIRLSGSESDTVLSILKTMLEHRSSQPDHPIEWDGKDWR